MNLNPASQLSLFGHQNEFINFIELYQNQKLPNKILLSGEKGIGKSTLAYHIINYEFRIIEIRILYKSKSNTNININIKFVYEYIFIWDFFFS